VILDCFAAIDTKQEAKKAISQFQHSIKRICQQAFEAVVSPYQHNPALIKTIALTRQSLNIELNKLMDK
jgi:hypothetical protein